MNESELKKVIQDYQSTLPEGCKERVSWEQFTQRAFAIYRDVWTKRVEAKAAAAKASATVPSDAPYGE